MKRLRRWWLKCLIESYTHDVLMLSERADNCRAQAQQAYTKVQELRRELAELCTKVHEHRDTLVGWIVIVGSCFVLWAFGKWS